MDISSDVVVCRDLIRYIRNSLRRILENFDRPTTLTHKHSQQVRILKSAKNTFKETDGCIFGGRTLDQTWEIQAPS